MRKEAWFGVVLMALVVAAIVYMLPTTSAITNEHLGLLMLALIVIGIMLGFPTAFTLMGMGMLFAWLAYRSADPDLAVRQTLDLMVQVSAYPPPQDAVTSAPFDLSERSFDDAPSFGVDSLQAPPGDSGATPDAPRADAAAPVASAAAIPQAAATATHAQDQRAAVAPSKWFWIVLTTAGVLTLAFYAWLDFARLEIFKMLLSSFFPLAVLIIGVLGSIVFGLATPTEAAAVGALGGAILAAPCTGNSTSLY